MTREQLQRLSKDELIESHPPAAGPHLAAKVRQTAIFLTVLA